MRIITVVALGALASLVAQSAWATDITGMVTAISGRSVTINMTVLTFPPPIAGQTDPMAGIQVGDLWTVTYNAGPVNTATKAVEVPLSDYSGGE